MSYREWKEWLVSLPWLLRWFVVLILIRPVIDNFYELKNISPLISPLNIVGVLTPVLVIAAVIHWRRRFETIIDFYFKIWSLLTLISIFFLFIFDPLSILFFEYLLRLTMPIYIYFFVRLLIRSKQDLHGVLQTFIYSSVVVLFVFLYEIIVNPIRVVESRGLERIQGHYGDVLNYSIYLTMAFLITCYFYFIKSDMKPSKRIRSVLVVGFLSILMLFHIHHSASYIIFAALVLMFLSFNFKENSGTTTFIVVLMVTFFYLFGQEIINEKINPLFQTDIAVYQGEKDSDRLLHGRVARWRMMLDEFSNAPVEAQLLGIPVNLEYSYYFISSNAHNDFLRILMLNGIIGLLVYLLILINLYKRFSQVYHSQRFLAMGAFIVLILYSVSTTPTLYPMILYVIYSIFAYVALPINFISENK